MRKSTEICLNTSTLANEIIERYSNYKWNKLSFAGKVKELATELFGMTVKDRNLLINLATKMRDIDQEVFDTEGDWKSNLYENSKNCIIIPSDKKCLVDGMKCHSCVQSFVIMNKTSLQNYYDFISGLCNLHPAGFMHALWRDL